MHASPPHRSHSLALFALILGNVALAFGPWFVRLAGTGPVAAGFWRLALALPFLFLLTRAMRQPIRFESRTTPVLAVAGLFFAADLACWHAGILHTRLANATLLGNLASFTFPLYGFLVARAWPRRGQAIALVLAAVGVGLLVGRSCDLSPRYLLGDLLSIAAGLLYTGYLIGIDRVRGRLQPWPTLALVTAFGAPPLLIAALLLGETILPQDWSALLALALASQVFGQGCLVYAIGRLPPLLIGLGLLSQPVIGAAIGWIGYGERLGPIDVAGGILIAIALIMVRRPEPAAVAKAEA